MANKYCMKCGTLLPEDANFCYKCGSPQNYHIDNSNNKENEEKNNSYVQPIEMWKLRNLLDDSIQQHNLYKSPLMTFVGLQKSVYYTIEEKGYKSINEENKVGIGLVPRKDGILKRASVHRNLQASQEALDLFDDFVFTIAKNLLGISYD